MSVTNNEALVLNIRDYIEDETLNAITNGGSQLYKKMAEFILSPLTVYLKKHG